jgi:putative FmdB family regulatory protein
MPIYEYVCTECDVKFDRLQPSGSSQSECPKCGMQSKKALSLFAAVSAGGDGETLPVAGMGGCCGGGGASLCGCGH